MNIVNFPNAWKKIAKHELEYNNSVSTVFSEARPTRSIENGITFLIKPRIEHDLNFDQRNGIEENCYSTRGEVRRGKNFALIRMSTVRSSFPVENGRQNRSQTIQVSEITRDGAPWRRQKLGIREVLRNFRELLLE